MASPSVFKGKRTKLLTAEGAELFNGQAIDFDGERNYIGYSRASANLPPTSAGYALYDDGAVAVPVDGTGGTATGCTLTRDTTAGNILLEDAVFTFSKDAADRQGKGFSYDFTVPLAFRNINHKLFTVIKTSAAYAAGDLVCYLYDVTTSALITPTVTAVPADVFGGSQFYCEWNLPVNTSSAFRIIFHIATTNASAWDFSFDALLVGPGQLVSGAAVGNWTSFPMTINSGGGNKGTPSIDAAYWRRVGDSMEIEYTYSQTVGGNIGSGTYTFSIPSGYSIDTTKLGGVNTNSTQGIVGSAACRNSGAYFWGYVKASSSTELVIEAGNSTDALATVGSAFCPLTDAPLRYSFRATVPIASWSSNVYLSPENIKSPAKAGFIQAYAGGTAPTGWAICDGSELAIATYPDLYANIGTTWNTSANPLTGSAQSAPSAGNFRIPNLKGTFLRGVADYAGADAYDTANDVALGVYRVDQGQGHVHTYSAWAGSTAATSAGANNGAFNTSTTGPVTDGTNGTPRVGYETAPKQVGITYIIKLFDDKAGALAGFATATTSQPVGLLKAGAIPGDTSGTDAAAGYQAQRLVFTSRTVTAGTPGSWAYASDALTTLTPGRWLLFGNATYPSVSGANNKRYAISASTTPGSALICIGADSVASNANAANDPVIPIPVGYVSVSVSTPIYAHAFAEDSGTNIVIGGYAIRIN